MRSVICRSIIGNACVLRIFLLYWGSVPAIFPHLFKKQTGKNYVEYLNEIRLKAVMEDLKNSDFKIAVIAGKKRLSQFRIFQPVL